MADLTAVADMTTERQPDRRRPAAALWRVAPWLLALASVGCSTQSSVSNAPDPQPRSDRLGSGSEPDLKLRSQKHLELASAYFGGGESATALNEVKLALASDPINGPAYNLRGLIYANLGDVKQAEDSFKRALQIEPNDANALQNYGWYLCQQQRYGQADALFVQALAVPGYRSSGRTALTRGVCQSRAGQKRDAERTLSSAYDLEPGNASIALALAEVLYDESQFERARFYARRVNSQPDATSAQSLWLAARIENRLGNQSAVDEFGRQLRGRYAQSRESSDFDRGRFDHE